MKCSFLLLIFVIGVFFFNQCEKEEPDCRDAYTGGFSFMNIVVTYYHTAPGVIFKYDYDTVFYDGLIEKDDTSNNRIIVHFGESTWGYHYESGIDTQVYSTDYPSLILGADGILSFPEFHGRSFEGHFINKDSIYLFMLDGTVGFGTTRSVYGKRIDP